MKLNCKIIPLLLLMILSANQRLTGQTYERSKNLTRSFCVDPQTEIQVINKYGNIHVVNWEKDSVRFDIDMVVKGNKQSKIQKNFEMIDFKFTKTDYYVIAETTIGSNQNSFWEEVTDLAQTIFNSSSLTEINYKVYMPRRCPLKIDNKFGNIYIGDHQGPVDIVLSNGNMKANAFYSDLKLDFDFGSVNIREINEARIHAGYAQIEIDRAEELIVESKSSELEIGIAGELSLNSRRDHIRVEEVRSLLGEFSFSEIRIDYFTGNTILNSNYGSMDVKSVSEGFNSIVLKAEYTDIDLNFGRETAYELKIEHADKTDISLPAELSVTGDEKNENTTLLNGKKGVGKKLPVVDIRITAGRVYITNY